MIDTWGAKSQFSYTGSVKEGTRITYGIGSKISVSSTQYKDLLNQFRGRTVSVSVSRSKTELQSLGNWLKSNVTNTAIAGYVAPILVLEGYASRTSNNEVKFNA